MRLGELRNKIVVERKVVDQDTFGGTTEVWVDFVQAWAAILPKSANERYNTTTDQKIAEATTLIKIKPCSGSDQITEKMRVKHNGNLLDITGVQKHVFGFEEELHLLCREVNPNGV